MKRFILVLLSVFIMSMLLVSASEQTETKIGSWCKIKQAWIGFKSEKDLDKLDDLLISKDIDAADTFIGIALVDGRATAFKIGEEVYFSDVRIIKEYVKIRRKGETTDYWAFKNIIKD